jgi:hypothetical protein
MALDRGPKRTDAPVGELVADVLTSRAALVGTPGSKGHVQRGPADRIGDALAYDVALVRLCDRMDISHDLAGDRAGPAARHRAEESLAERFPSIAAVLEGDDPVPNGPES